jgi:hypothetical protein
MGETPSNIDKNEIDDAIDAAMAGAATIQRRPRLGKDEHARKILT